METDSYKTIVNASDEVLFKDKNSKFTGKQWTTKVIKTLWDQLYKIWKIRSKRQHSSDTRQCNDYEHQEALATAKTFVNQ